MLTLIENGEIYDPEPRGRGSVLVVGGRIARLGEVSGRAVEALGLESEIIDAADCLVVPGFIDPHEHLAGGSGERGFSTQTPEIRLEELVSAGITTVVGCLGVDTTTRTMPGLLARAKALREEGLTAFIYTGGYNVPPTTLTGSVRDDILFVAEVIGAGEVAVSDLRATEPAARELARLVSDAYVGGLLTKKAGVTHFHVGDGKRRLEPLRTLLDEYEVEPSWLYPTHVERNRALMEEAIELTRRGVTVDVDTVEEDLAKWLKFYLDCGGDAARLTTSSDASIKSPLTLSEQIRDCVVNHRFPLELVLRLVTSNTARVLKLDRKGRLAAGMDADVLVLRKGSLEIREVIAGGRRMMRDGRVVVSEKFLEDSNRMISVSGNKSGGE
ncbi:MAG TPA: beta-aspartyl-peptidase [Pyrinomonadaceae bacterium]|jgi:beta-aspartyl-dipeptidase (metallo-type)